MDFQTQVRQKRDEVLKSPEYQSAISALKQRADAYTKQQNLVHNNEKPKESIER